MDSTSFIGGCIVGGLAVLIVADMLLHWEWSHRRKIERKVDEMWKHLACGKGILGCDAGPDCDWDHK